MADEILDITGKLDQLSDVCSCAAFGTGEAVAQINYKKYRRQVDIISGSVAILDQLSTELKHLSERVESLANKG